MIKIAAILFATGGWATTAMLAASEPNAVEEANLTLNQVTIVLMSIIGVLIAAIGYGLRTWSHSVDKQIQNLGKEMADNTTELAKLTTVMREREGQAAQISTLFALLGELRVEVAVLAGRAPSPGAKEGHR